VSIERLPRATEDGATLWVTRSRPKVDRIACPWLIRRFVDPRARFLLVPVGDASAVAEQFGATPFDLEHEGVYWSHLEGECTFDLMVEAFGLAKVAALAHLAVIVRGADTGRPDLVPKAAGLLAVSLGLSRIYSDDLEPLFPDPLLLLDEDRVHHRDLTGGAAKTERRDPRPEAHRFAERNAVIAGGCDMDIRDSHCGAAHRSAFLLLK